MEPTSESSDAAAYFGSRDEIVDYLNTWLADGSPREIARALGDVARSNGLTEPEALYAALSLEGNPTLEALTAVLAALSLELSVRKKAA